MGGTPAGVDKGAEQPWCTQSSRLVRRTLQCVQRGLLRLYDLTHNIRSHEEQTYDRKQVHEKAHGGTLLVLVATKLTGGRKNSCDACHICPNSWLQFFLGLLKRFHVLAAMGQ